MGGQAPVVEESPQGDALVARVAKPVLDRRFIEHVVEFGVAPIEETIDDGLRLVAPCALFFFSRRIRDGPLDPEQRSDVRKSYFGALGI